MAWVCYHISCKAKDCHALKEEKRKQADIGKLQVDKWFKKIALNSSENIESLYRRLKLHSKQDLFHEVALGIIKLDKTVKFKLKQGKFVWPKGPKPGTSPKTAVAKKFIKPKKEDTLLIGENMQKIDYKLAPCCNPIP